MNASTNVPLTPLQQVLLLTAEMWRLAAELLDEHEHKVFLNLHRERVAKESAKHLAREWREAA